mmetsp:Transcript_16714/g.34332  ORF Transcript_16714/g.34332 Transcript_16714/m.34332 type:complete len:307 (-) Transcript_16714:215-1135(-)
MQNTLSRGRLALTESCRPLVGQCRTKVNISHRHLLVSIKRTTTTHHLVRPFSEGGSYSSGRFSFRSFFDWYSKKLDTHPITTKAISAGLISSLGNVLAQWITHQQNQDKNKDTGSSTSSKILHKPFELNLAQISRFALLNAAFVAPVLHNWYQFINRTVPGRSFSRVLQRTFWDEFVFSPMYIPAFLGMLWKLEGVTNEKILEMIKSECPSIIVAEWAMWVPTMIVTFRYAPVKFQVLVINVVGVVWQTFLAHAANKAHSSSSEVVVAVKNDDKYNEKASTIIIPEEKVPSVLDTSWTKHNQTIKE